MTGAEHDSSIDARPHTRHRRGGPAVTSQRYAPADNSYRLPRKAQRGGTPFGSLVSQPGAGLRQWVPTVAPAALAIGAAATWATSLKDVNLRAMDDLGLISVLPGQTVVAFALLTAGFCLGLRQRPLRTPLLLFHVLLTILFFYGTPALVEEVPRANVAWRYSGIAEYVMRTGSINPSLETYFNWPGFFTLAALATRLAGLDNPVALTNWAAVCFNLLYLGPLLILFRSSTRDERLVWLGVWFFYLSNWVGQDAFLPQALGLFWYLVLLAVLLRWFRRPGALFALGWLPTFGVFGRVGELLASFQVPRSTQVARSTPWQRVGLMAVVILVYAVMAASHQLTPFMALVAVAILVACRRVTSSSLPVLMAVLTAAWISFMTVAFLTGHSSMVTGNVGDVSQNLDASLTSRLQGSPGHLLVVRLRVVLTVAILALAALGGLRRLWSRHWDIELAILAVAPFGLLALQAYGGEILLRAYFFALPAAVFFTAAAFYPHARVRSAWPTIGAVGLVSIVLAGGFLVARYGNERMDAYSAAEVAAVRYLYSVATPGSLIVTGTWNAPVQFQDYEKFEYRELPLRVILDQDPAEMAWATLQQSQSTQTYILLTETEGSYAELFYGLTPDDWARFEEALSQSDRFKLLFANSDARILVPA